MVSTPLYAFFTAASRVSAVADAAMTRPPEVFNAPSISDVPAWKIKVSSHISLDHLKVLGSSPSSTVLNVISFPFA
jgi:hypothetical protein